MKSIFSSVFDREYLVYHILHKMKQKNMVYEKIVLNILNLKALILRQFRLRNETPAEICSFRQQKGDEY